MKVNGPEMSIKIRTGKKSSAMGEACVALFSPTPGFNGRTFVSSGFSIERISISASAVPFTGAHLFKDGGHLL